MLPRHAIRLSMRVALALSLAATAGGWNASPAIPLPAACRRHPPGHGLLCRPRVGSGAPLGPGGRPQPPQAGRGGAAAPRGAGGCGATWRRCCCCRWKQELGLYVELHGGCLMSSGTGAAQGNSAARESKRHPAIPNLQPPTSSPSAGAGVFAHAGHAGIAQRLLDKGADVHGGSGAGAPIAWAAGAGKVSKGAGNSCASIWRGLLGSDGPPF